MIARRSRKRKHALQRARQARYQARINNGVLLCPVQLRPEVITMLVRLRWLSGDVITAKQAGAAIERLLAQL